MANAAAKKAVAQNERAVRNLHVGMAVASTLSVFVRLLRTRGLFSLSFGSPVFVLLIFSYAVSSFLYMSLVRVGRPPARDASGNLRGAPGVDLANPGYIYEWMFDTLYISWACQVGSALFGEYVWWLYTSIPGYVIYKLGPMAYRFFQPSSAVADDDDSPAASMSKRQQKLKARQDRGDPRVKSVSIKR